MLLRLSLISVEMWYSICRIRLQDCQRILSPQAWCRMLRIVLALLLACGVLGMPGGSTQEDVGHNAGGSGGSGGGGIGGAAAVVDHMDPEQVRRRREDEGEEEDVQAPEQNPSITVEQIAEEPSAGGDAALADRMTAREAAAIAPHPRQMMRVEAVGSSLADMVLIPDHLTPPRYFGSPSNLIPGSREIITSMTGYSDAGFVTTTYRMFVEEVTSVRCTHAEWLIATRDVAGLGPRLVVRHFNMPREDVEMDEDGGVVP